MGGLKPIGSEKLQGMDKIRRIMEIARYNENIPQPLNETGKDEYSVTFADGNVYTIVKEKLGYIIKKSLNESETDYLGSITERKYYNSYSQALKRLNLMIKEVNTLVGNKTGISLFEGDDVKKKYTLKLPTKKETNEGLDLELDEQVPAPVPAPQPVEPQQPAPAPVPAPQPVEPQPEMGGEEEMIDEPMDDEPMDDESEKKGEEISFKTIQKLTGRLTQKIRKYTEEDEMSSDDTKYIINSILSSLDLDVLDDDDVDQIIDRLEGDDTEDDEEFNDGEDMDVPMDDEMMGTDMGVTPEPPVAPEPTSELGEDMDGYPRHGAMLNRHKHLTHGTFGESTVDQIISNYFKIDENEMLVKEEETRKKLLYNQAKNKKYIKQLSESVNQERAAFKLIENYPNSKIMGKSKTGNLIFKNKDKKYYITSNGKFI
jgi:hypothetical protein